MRPLWSFPGVINRATAEPAMLSTLWCPEHISRSVAWAAGHTSLPIMDGRGFAHAVRLSK